MIISENRLQTEIVWSHIRRIWETFRVFKISLLHLNDLKVLRIFDQGFYKYVKARKPNYGINNVKKHPLRVAIFPRMPSIIYYDGEWTGFDWKTLKEFSKRMNFDLQTTWFPDQWGFGRFVSCSVLLQIFISVVINATSCWLFWIIFFILLFKIIFIKLIRLRVETRKSDRP